MGNMNKYNISTNPIRVIKNLYDKVFNSKHRRLIPNNSWSQTECLLSPTLFNVFLERIMTDALEDHEGTVSTRGRTITDLRFADDINGLAAEEELAKFVERLDKASTAYGREIC